MCQDSRNLGNTNDDFIVNFDISYADGKSESYVCGSQSGLFGGIESSTPMNESNYNERINPMNELNYKENLENYFECGEMDEEDNHYFNSNYDYGLEWTNCEEEIAKKNNYDNCICDECNTTEYITGEINVFSTLNSVDGTRIKGVKVNLYEINGVSPQLIESKVTDCNGNVLFSNIPAGNYRIIQLIDKRYFNKPAYVNWNEVRIDCNCRNFTLYVVNTINENCRRKGR